MLYVWSVGWGGLQLLQAEVGVAPAGVCAIGAYS